MKNCRILLKLWSIGSLQEHRTNTWRTLQERFTQSDKRTRDKRDCYVSGSSAIAERPRRRVRRLWPKVERNILRTL